MRGGKIGRRDGSHGKRWRRPVAQEDVYGVVGGQLGPRRRGLLEYGVLGGIVVDVRDATETQSHHFQPPDGGRHGPTSEDGNHAGSPADRQLNRRSHEQRLPWERVLRQDHAKRGCGILPVPRHIDDEMQWDNHLRRFVNRPTKQ